MLIKDQELYIPSLMGQNVRYGAIKGVAVGQCFKDRLELRLKNVHNIKVAGVAGNVKEGAASVVVSGGYEDDIDMGDIIEYTGAGGQDDSDWGPQPRNQTKNQQWGNSQKMLQRSYEAHRPVRVIRGFSLKSKYAPAKGYRYDGLYHVTKVYETTGKSGYTVWKFQLQRLEDINQPPIPVRSFIQSYKRGSKIRA
ncbi:SRA-YDG [Pluteus cervinus]|uniref:SRA-YDG n=1 Tax=Pluteus cervinus TaxID=181527 RepID=A0ACD3B026_9AGAR|nr:SRA-YDG [Pluteus cervinus]